MLRSREKYGKNKKMFGDAQAVRAYFFKLGLSSEIADIYLALHAHGKQTISELARHSGIERTRIYRLMDKLTTSNLVEVEQQYKRMLISAAPVSNLQLLLVKKEQELQELHGGLHDLQQLITHSSLQSPTTKIQSYKGADGLKQMLWNETRSTTENLSILYENM